MKRIVSTICIMAILFLCSGTALAETPAVITGELEFVKRGGYVDYTVNISGNPGISAYLIFVDCDQSVFSVEYDENDESYKVTNGSDFSAGSISCNVNGSKGYQVSWYDSNGVVRKDGNLFTLRLKAAETAEPGEYPITIRYSEKNTLGADMEKLGLNCISGTITVAPDEAVIAVESCRVTTGCQFNLKVRLNENPGIAAYSVYLLFDTSVFSAIPIENGEGYSVISGSEFAQSNILCNSYSNKGYRIQWWNSTESIKPGTLFELPLKVAANAAEGDYPVQIRVVAADTTDEKGTPVTTALTDGIITVDVELWKDVTAVYNSEAKTVTVTVTPCMQAPSGNVTLVAVSYSDKGQMLSCKLVEFNGAGTPQQRSFTLSCPDRVRTIVKLFALDRETHSPICMPLLIEPES